MQIFEYKHWVALIYILVLFLDRLDITIVNIALPTLAAHFQIPIASTSAINTSFLLALAIAIPMSNWLSHHFGAQRVFIAATALFGLTSSLCAFAPNLIAMILLRYLQGIGGGIIIPVGMTMVYRNFAPSEYASITSYIFMPTLAAPAIAPALGGAIIKYLSWQWIFLLAVPICSLAILLAWLKLDKENTLKKEYLDWLGFILISVSLSLLFYTFTLAGNSGLNSVTFLYGALAIILIMAFIYYENKISFPLFDLYFFKNRTFVQVNLIQLAFQICHFGSFFLIGIYLQIYAHMSALAAGTIIGMQALSALIISRTSVRLFNHHGAKMPIVTGLLGIAIFSLAILFIKTPQQFIAACVLLFIRGIFSGLCGTPIQTMSVIDFNKDEVGKVNAIFNVSRQLAISLGIALFSLLIAYSLKNTNIDTVEITQSTFYLPFLLIPFIASIGIIIALTIKK